ncbi:MAG TPA: lipocalin family protein, partial [Polyangiaceae bacterium]
MTHDPISNPSDWPKAGPIDLERHDRPHASASLEWWYVNAHLETNEGTPYAVFAAFFRSLRKAEHAADEPSHFHALTYRLVNLETREAVTCSLLEDTVMAEMRHRLATARDMPFMKRALLEQLDLGQIPAPDRLLKTRPTLPMDRLALDMDGQRFEKLADGRYRLDLSEAARDFRLVLDFKLEIPVVRHGDDGVVRGVGAEEMFYYFCPRCEVHGTLGSNGEYELRGKGWYDHEFGSVPEARRNEAEQAKVGWNWIAAQLDTGWQISAYDLFDLRSSEKSVGHWLIAIDPDGKHHALSEFSLTPEAFWMSTRTFTRWPTRWRLQIPALELNLVAEARVPSDEFQTLLAPPAFWEGRVDLTGTQGNSALAGRGYVERNGLGVQTDIGGFLSDVGKETREQLRALLSVEPNEANAVRLVSRAGYAQPLDAQDLARLGGTLVAPVRHVVELGGKAWRS